MSRLLQEMSEERRRRWKIVCKTWVPRRILKVKPIGLYRALITCGILFWDDGGGRHRLNPRYEFY